MTPQHDVTNQVPTHTLTNLTATEYKHLSQHLQVLRADPAAADYIWTVCEDVLLYNIRPAGVGEDGEKPLTWDELARLQPSSRPSLQ